MSQLTAAEIQELAAVWYKKLDVHAPLEDYRPLLAEKDLVLQFPEGNFTNFDGFQAWYDNVLKIFFDEQHTLKTVEIISNSDDKAEVKVVVNWQASRWNPPTAKSDRIIMDAYQTWTVIRSPETQKAVILVYKVDYFDYAPESVRLESTRDVINNYYKYVNAGDWDNWLSIFDDHLIMDEQLAGHLEGNEPLKGAVDGITKGYNKFIMTPKQIVVEGEKGTVIWDFDGANASDVPIKAKGANYFEVKNGKITYMANFHDTIPFKPFTEQKLG